VSYPIYTVRFCEAGGAGKVVDYAVPGGKRAVVTCLVASAYQSNAEVWLTVHGAGSLLWTTHSQAVTDGESQNVRMVAYSGELIQLATIGTQVYAHVAGYLFDDNELRAGTLPGAGENPDLPWLPSSS
jgi:hypothetical protein